MKKTLVIVALLIAGSLAGCNEGTDNAQMRRDDMAPIQHTPPEERDTVGQPDQQQDTLGSGPINNNPTTTDEIEVQPYGTGKNI